MVSVLLLELLIAQCLCRTYQMASLFQLDLIKREELRHLEGGHDVLVQESSLRAPVEDLIKKLTGELELDEAFVVLVGHFFSVFFRYLVLRYRNHDHEHTGDEE